jgi:hypothetical protein
MAVFQKKGMVISLEITFFLMAEGRLPGLKQDRSVAQQFPSLIEENVDHVVQCEFTPAGQTVDMEYYLQVLWYLCNAVHLRRPEK